MTQYKHESFMITVIYQALASVLSDMRDCYSQHPCFISCILRMTAPGKQYVRCLPEEARERERSHLRQSVIYSYMMECY